ncbi:Macrolide export ATP-binding/permease protein MacB [Alphaproteobacteria bacterium SO-S41]|nr:Macrolide export ATP-binding/permease protein MacB [Alphaproteobacteria bacterium SO-S41]
MISSALRLALRELWANKLRTFLTCTGMIIGVGAVIALLTIGAGVTASINHEFASIGKNLVWIWPGGEQQRGPAREVKRFTWRDLDLVRRTVPGVVLIAPSVGSGHSVKFGNLDTQTTIIGTTPDYFPIRLWTFAEGRPFSDAESGAGRMACVMGQSLRAKLFGNANPVGQRVRIDGLACEVIGLLAPKGAGTFGQDEDDRIIMPLRAYQRRFTGDEWINTLQLMASSSSEVQPMIEGARAVLRQARNIPTGKPDDFTIEDVNSFGEETTAVLGYVTLFVGAVAFISLIVGGIGIMNIMLVSVTERTREIGIRLAIGAQERDVLTQFLIEAMTLAVLGGLAGVLLGLFIAWMVTGALGWAFLPSAPLIIGATVFSALIGIGFGFFPARRAARLNPIEALRFE